MSKQKDVLDLIFQPKSESVDEVNDLFRAMTKKGKESSDPEVRGYFSNSSQQGNVSMPKADQMALRGEQVSNANRKTTAEKCLEAYGRIASANKGWSYTRVCERAAEELNISTKQFQKYVKHPNRNR